MHFIPDQTGTIPAAEEWAGVSPVKDLEFNIK